MADSGPQTTGKPTEREAMARLVCAIEGSWPGDGLTYASVVAALQADGKPELADVYAQAWHVLIRKEYARG